MYGVPLCAVQRCRSSVGAIPTRQLSFQPVAIETIGEVTNRSKLSMERAASGGSASGQAVTCVNAEQASKSVLLWEPTRHCHGEGRRHGLSTCSSDKWGPWSHRGNGDGMSAQGDRTQHGRPRAVAA
jgi:hypothetical protein